MGTSVEPIIPKMQHDQFVTRLQSLLKYLDGKKNNKHYRLVQKLLQDNVGLSEKIVELMNENKLLKEQLNGKANDGEAKQRASGNVVGTRTSGDSTGHSDPKDSTTPVHVGEG